MGLGCLQEIAIRAVRAAERAGVVWQVRGVPEGSATEASGIEKIEAYEAFVACSKTLLDLV